MKIIGSTKPYALAEKAKSILKINGDYSFIAIPTDVLEKYAVDSFEIIIDSDNKIKLVGPIVNRPGPTPTPATEVDVIDNWTQEYKLLPTFTPKFQKIM